ncbi:hypothetical protein ES703_14164 [subsurface metagenome]
MIKMLKILASLVLIVILLLGLCSVIQASLWVKGMGFYYSPDYGDLGEGLDKAKPYYETPKVLKSGTGGAFAVGYDFGNWGLMLDTFNFTGIADYHHKRLVDTFKFETSTSPVLLSLVYRVPTEGQFHPYLGAGVGSFPSKLKITSNIHKGMQEKDSPTGFQLLAGAEYRLRDGLFFSGEVRYLSATAKYSGYRCIESCSTDWSGIFFSIGIGYKCKL